MMTKEAILKGFAHRKKIKIFYKGNEFEFEVRPLTDIEAQDVKEIALRHMNLQGLDLEGLSFGSPGAVSSQEEILNFQKQLMTRVPGEKMADFMRGSIEANWKICEYGITEPQFTLEEIQAFPPDVPAMIASEINKISGTITSEEEARNFRK